jgi:hypothetical protein
LDLKKTQYVKAEPLKAGQLANRCNEERFALACPTCCPALRRGVPPFSPLVPPDGPDFRRLSRFVSRRAMADPVQVLAAAENSEVDPPRSKLDPYAEALWALRRKRKRLRAIAVFLREHGIEVSKSTVARWLKRHPQPKPEAELDRQLAPSRNDERPGASQPADRARARSFFNSTTDQEP